VGVDVMGYFLFFTGCTFLAGFVYVVFTGPGV